MTVVKKQVRLSTFIPSALKFLLLLYFLVDGFLKNSVVCSTERETESGTVMLNWDSRYLCHFSTEMAEIWSPGTSFQDVWTCKISALYLLYFQSYESFCGVFSDFH